MNLFWSFTRSIVVIIAASLGLLALFGLLLAAGYAVAPVDTQYMELVITLTAATIAFLGGGWLAGRMSPEHPLRMGLIFGLVFGGCSLGYILPEPWLWPLATGTAMAISIAGAYLADGRRRP